MEQLFVLPHGNLVARSSIKGVIKFKDKGVGLRNEFNKPLDYIPEPDAGRQHVIVTVIANVLKNRNWEQPDWDTEFATAPDLKNAKNA